MSLSESQVTPNNPTQPPNLLDLDNFPASQQEELFEVDLTERISDINLFNCQLDNSYSSDAGDSFIVNIYDVRPKENLGNHHKLPLGRAIFKAGFTEAFIVSKSLAYYFIVFNLPREANAFRENVIKINPHWRGFLLNEQLFKIGIVRNIPPDFENDELMAALDPISRSLIHGFIRINKKVRTQPGRRNSRIVNHDL